MRYSDIKQNDPDKYNHILQRSRQYYYDNIDKIREYHRRNQIKISQYNHYYYLCHKGYFISKCPKRNQKRGKYKRKKLIIKKPSKVNTFTFDEMQNLDKLDELGVPVENGKFVLKFD
jgi:hypothetical protein